MNGGDEMSGESLVFKDMIFEARRVTVELDDVTQRDGHQATTAPVNRGKRVYVQLFEYRRTSRMTPQEAHALQEALDQLQARLKFFGQSV